MATTETTNLIVDILSSPRKQNSSCYLCSCQNYAWKGAHCLRRVDALPGRLVNRALSACKAYPLCHGGFYLRFVSQLPFYKLQVQTREIRQLNSGLPLCLHP